MVRQLRRPGCDVDCLFLQVFVDQPIVSDAQNCGNILAGVRRAIERGLVAATHPETVVRRIHMENTGQVAVVRVANAERPGYAYRSGTARWRTFSGSLCPSSLPIPLVQGTVYCRRVM